MQPWFDLGGFLEVSTLVPLLVVPLVLPSPRFRPEFMRFIPLVAFLLYALIAVGVLIERPPRIVAASVTSVSVGIALRLAFLLGVVLFTQDVLTSRGAWRTAQARLYLAAYLAPTAALAVLDFVPLRAVLTDWAPRLYPVLAPVTRPNLMLLIGGLDVLALLTPFVILGSALVRRVPFRTRRVLVRELGLVSAAAAVGLLLGSSGRTLDLAWAFLRPVLFVAAVFAFRVVDWGKTGATWLLPAALVASFAAVLFTTTAYAADLGADAEMAMGLGLVLAVAVLTAMAWPLFARRPDAQPTKRAAAADLYRNAVEAVLDDPLGAGPDSERMLRALRERLGLSELDHLDTVASMRGPNGASAGTAAVMHGRYRLVRALGEGGFGRVDLAWDDRMGREVVLKSAKAGTPGAAQRLMREARVLARLNHPNIVAIHDILEESGGCVLVMEYVAGGSLREGLDAGPVANEDARRWMLEVLEALTAAHAHGIVHRDIKPSNVLLSPDGHASLADFGIAHEDASGTGTLDGYTRPGRQPGSVAYMAPEQVRGAAVGPRTDLYAVAAVLYEALAGKPYLPFPELAEYEARLAILDREPELPLSGLPPAWNAFLAQGLAKDPGRRFTDAVGMRKALAALPASTPLKAKGSSAADVRRTGPVAAP